MPLITVPQIFFPPIFFFILRESSPLCYLLLFSLQLTVIIIIVIIITIVVFIISNHLISAIDLFHRLYRRPNFFFTVFPSQPLDFLPHYLRYQSLLPSYTQLTLSSTLTQKDDFHPFQQRLDLTPKSMIHLRLSLQSSSAFFSLYHVISPCFAFFSVILLSCSRFNLPLLLFQEEE